MVPQDFIIDPLVKKLAYTSTTVISRVGRYFDISRYTNNTKCYQLNFGIDMFTLHIYV